MSNNSIIPDTGPTCSATAEQLIDASTSLADRLGKCEVCNYNISKYTCPKCELKTCSLACIKIHKKELDCNGIRDKTKYIPIRKLTENDLMSDYTFLENCTQFVALRKQDIVKRYTRFNKTPPIHLVKLEAAAKERKIKLKFLLQNFTKNKLNTTYYEWKSKVIYWRVEWHFVNADDAKFVDERCSEHNSITTLLNNCLALNGALGSGVLQYYQARGLNNVRVLLKAEGIRNSKNRFYELDVEKSLSENLMRKTIIEFPVIFVIYRTDSDDLDIIDSDEEDVDEETRKHLEIYFTNNRRDNLNEGNKQSNATNSDNVKTTETIPKRDLPQNLLFTDETMDWDGILDEDENDA